MALALDDSIFSAESYRLNIPTQDGYTAAKLELRFSGSGVLDRTSVDDLALLEAARLGEPVRLIVVGEFCAKGFKLDRNRDGEGELGYSCTVKVLGVEAGELA
jgi:hypothetical protein